MKSMFSLKFALKIAVIPLTLCALTGCWKEWARVNPDDRFRSLSDTDVALLEEYLESMGRAEEALRIVTLNNTNTNPPAKTTALANTLLPSVCVLNSQTIENKWGPADLRLSSQGRNCPLVAEIQTESSRQGLQTNLVLSFTRRIPEAQRLADAREVVALSVSGTRQRREITEIALPSTQTTDEIQGFGKLLNEDKVEIRVITLTRQIYAKTTVEYRRRTMNLTVKTRSYALESEEDGSGGAFYRLNGKDIPAATFEDYFSRVGFIGKLSPPSTDAG